MTNGNNSSDRLYRIEAIVESNSRAIQTMIEQEATDRLRHEERMERHDQEIAELRDIASRLTEVQIGMARMLSNIDETNPTILRRFITIENKVDRIINKTIAIALSLKSKQMQSLFS